jgi:hypothetical protein
MANNHIQTTDGSELVVVVHFAVPDTNNAAGVNWRIIAARFHGTTVLVDGDGTNGTISSAEKSQIVAGALVEQTITFKLGNNNPTGPQIDSAYSAAQTAFNTEFQNKYNRYGQTR